MFELREDAPYLFQNLNQLSQASSEEASSSGGVISTLNKPSASASTGAQLMNPQAVPTRGALGFTDLAHLLPPTSSNYSLEPITGSTIKSSFGHEIMIASTFPRSQIEQTTTANSRAYNVLSGLVGAIIPELPGFAAQPSYVLRDPAAPMVVSTAPHVEVPSTMPSAPYTTTADPAELASIISSLERRKSYVQVNEPVLCDAVPVTLPGLSSLAPDMTTLAAGPHDLQVLNIRVSAAQESSSATHSAAHPPTGGSRSVTVKYEPCEDDEDSAACVKHQRQHLLSTSLGPGAYFRARKRRTYRHESFPEKLHRMLEEASAKGMDDVVGFTPSGLAFEIRDVDAFVRDVIPGFFRHRSVSSFRRQLSMYGFKRIKGRGLEHGAYQHELFRRDEPELCRQMKRVPELELILPDDPTASFRN